MGSVCFCEWSVDCPFDKYHFDVEEGVAQWHIRHIFLIFLFKCS